MYEHAPKKLITFSADISKLDKAAIKLNSNVYLSELSPEQQRQLIRLQQQLGAAMEEQVIPSIGRIFKKAELCCKATLVVLFVFLVMVHTTFNHMYV